LVDRLCVCSYCSADLDFFGVAADVLLDAVFTLFGDDFLRLVDRLCVCS
jgi:hypothetical protein